MKKHFLTFSFALLSVVAFTQVPKRVLVEHFTGANCTPCANAKPTIEAALKKYADQVAVIRYHFPAPSADVFYNQNPSDVEARATLYGVSSVPAMAVRGSRISDVYRIESVLANATTEMSPFSLNVKHRFDGKVDSLIITGVIKAEQDTNMAGLYLMLALNEQLIAFDVAPGSNGEKEFGHVMRLLQPSTDGESLAESWTNGDSLSFSYTVAIPEYVYKKSEIEVLAWLQSAAGVVQSAVSPAYFFPRIKAVEIPEFSLQPTQLTPVVLIDNQGDENLTKIDFSYYVNEGETKTQSWAGSIAVGDTQSIVFPDINIVSRDGVNTLFISYIVNNASEEERITYEKDFYSFSSYQSDELGMLTFDPKNFPPQNVFVVDQDGMKWSYASDLFNASNRHGFLKANLYGKASGTKATLYLPAQNINQENAVLGFRYAHSLRLRKGQDRMLVQVSEDGGSSWKTIFDKSGSELTTISRTNSVDYYPSAKSDFKDTAISLQAFSGKDVILRFQAISDYGNNIYLDQIYVGEERVSVKSNKDVVRFFNNPVVDKLVFDCGDQLVKQVAVYDLLGRKIWQQRYLDRAPAQKEVDFSWLSAGIYVVDITTDQGFSQLKMIKQ